MYVYLKEGLYTRGDSCSYCNYLHTGNSIVSISYWIPQSSERPCNQNCYDWTNEECIGLQNWCMTLRASINQWLWEFSNFETWINWWYQLLILSMYMNICNTIFIGTDQSTSYYLKLLKSLKYRRDICLPSYQVILWMIDQYGA